MANIIFSKLYIILHHFEKGSRSELGKLSNRKISLINGLIRIGTSKIFRMVGMEVDRSIRPQKTVATRSDAANQRALASGFSSLPRPAILRARLSLLKIKKNVITAIKTANTAKHKMPIRQDGKLKEGMT